MKKNIIIGFYTICSISILLLANWFLFIRDRGKLNIIFISVDTLRQDHLGIYGYNRNTSPNIDRYFKDSFIFKNAYTATPKTYASFVSLFTGLEPSQTNIFDYNGRPLKNTEKTLTQYLKEKNFNTAAFVVNGALHYSINNEETNLQKGFDYWDYLPYFEKANLINSSSQITKEVYEHRITKAIAWLRDNRKNNKFVWFHFIDPHSPYAPERKDICEVSPEVCHKILKANTVENIRLKYKGQSNGCYTTTPPKNIIDSLVKYYDAEIHYTDRLIGKLTKYFDISGISENSIIIFLADHGEGLDHGYYFQHGPLFDSNVKIPLIVKYPNTQGRTVKRLVANSDILPTILQLLDINNTSNVKTFSFANELTDFISDSTNRQEIRFYMKYDGLIHKYKGSFYKYLLNKNQSIPGCIEGQNEALFDISSDKNENRPITSPSIRKYFRNLYLTGE